MKNNDKILRYIAEDMSGEEKLRFEKELEDSPQLKRRFEKTVAELNRFKTAAADVEVDETYFNNLIPRVVDRVEKKKKRGFVLGLSFGGAIAAVLVLFVFTWYGVDSGTMFNEEFNEVLAEAVTETDYEDVNDYLAFYDTYSYTSVDYVENNEIGSDELIGEFVEQYDYGITDETDTYYDNQEVPVIDEMIDYEEIPEENIESLYDELKKTNIL